MSTNKNFKDIEVEVDEIRAKTASTLVKNQKLITGVIAAVVVLIVAFFVYKYFIQAPNEEKGQQSIYTAEQYFGIDSFNLALNGDGQKDGFLQVISKYGGTKAGNLAHYYAGRCYLEMGQAKEAIKHLEKFSGSGTDLEYTAQGMLAGAYADDGNVDKALSTYNKAVKNKNVFYTPFFLRSASIVAYEAGKAKEAIDFELKIKQEYPGSQQFRDTDKYLALYGHSSTD